MNKYLWLSLLTDYEKVWLRFGLLGMTKEKPNIIIVLTDSDDDDDEDYFCEHEFEY